MKILKRFKDNRGSALLIVLSLIAMLTGVVIMTLDRAHTDVELSFNQLHEEQAFYVAEAGMERAVAELNLDSDWRTGYLTEPLGDGYYTVAVIDSISNPSLGDTVVLRATASVSGTSSNIESWLVPDGSGSFKQAAFGDVKMAMGSSGCTDSYNSDSGTYAATQSNLWGSIGTNDTLLIQSLATVGGDASTAALGNITISGTPTINGDTTSHAPVHPLNLVGDADYTWAQDNNSRYTGMSGSYSFSPGPLDMHIGDYNQVTLQPGTYYFTSVHLDHESRLNVGAGGAVKIFVTGNVVVENEVRLNTGGKPANLNIYTKGTVVNIGSQSEFRGTLYSPNCDFLHNNSAGIYGAIIAKSIKIDNNGCIHFDRALLNDNLGSAGGDFTIIAWRLME